jgi:hypothetical protein
MPVVRARTESNNDRFGKGAESQALPMSARQANYQPDLLHRATMEAERERLAPEIRAIVISLLKQLLTECVSGAAEKGSSDE